MINKINKIKKFLPNSLKIFKEFWITELELNQIWKNKNSINNLSKNIINKISNISKKNLILEKSKYWKNKNISNEISIFLSIKKNIDDFNNSEKDFNNLSRERKINLDFFDKKDLDNSKLDYFFILKKEWNITLDCIRKRPNIYWDWFDELIEFHITNWNDNIKKHLPLRIIENHYLYDNDFKNKLNNLKKIDWYK